MSALRRRISATNLTSRATVSRSPLPSASSSSSTDRMKPDARLCCWAKLETSPKLVTPITSTLSASMALASARMPSPLAFSERKSSSMMTIGKRNRMGRESCRTAWKKRGIMGARRTPEQARPGPIGGRRVLQGVTGVNNPRRTVVNSDMDRTRGETMQRWLAVIVAFVLAGCAAATPADAQSPASEPPLIAGRVAVADGDAQIWRAEEDSAAGQWDDAIVNDVVSAGAGLHTGSDGRNEVRVGPHTFRMAATAAAASPSSTTPRPCSTSSTARSTSVSRGPSTGKRPR
jgi:hypothetical protein